MTSRIAFVDQPIPMTAPKTPRSETHHQLSCRSRENLGSGYLASLIPCAGLGSCFMAAEVNYN